MNMIRVSLALQALLLWTSVQSEEIVARLKERPFQESYQHEAPVSGRVVAGVSLSGVPIASQEMLLLPPTSAAGSSVCVQAMSRDGRYWSRNSFELPAEFTTNAVALEYLTDHQDFLQTLKEDELAILGSSGDCGDTDLSMLLLANRAEQGDLPPRVQVFVNSYRADTYVAVKNHPVLRRPKRCESIEKGRRTAYDTVCNLPLAELGTTADKIDVRILRRHYERMLPPVEFTLQLPSLKDYALKF